MTTPRRNDPTNAARQAAWRRCQAQPQAQVQAMAAKGWPTLPPIVLEPVAEADRLALRALRDRVLRAQSCR